MAVVVDEGEPIESSLPRIYHDIYRLRLSEAGVREIADKYHISRTTVWRYLTAVREDFERSLGAKSVINIISEELLRITDVEEQARESALRCGDDKVKAGF